jgi:uncharacterized protein (TIGR00369 family)
MAPVENRGLAEQLFWKIVKDIEEMPALQKMNIKLKYLAPGGAGFEMYIDPDYANSRRTAHGGLIASLMDTVMGYAGISLDLKLVTVEMNLNYFAAVKIGEVITAEAKVIHAGKTTVVAEAEVYNAQKELVSKSRGTYFPVGKVTEQ